MRRQAGYWLVFFLLVSVAAVDITTNGWFTGIFPQGERNEALSQSTVNASARIGRIANGREFATNLAATGVERLVIDNPGGSVVVNGSADNEIKLQAWLIVYSNDETESKRLLEQAQFNITVEEGILRPRFEPDPSIQLAGELLWDVLWEITVPADLAVDIVNRDGPVTVLGLSGALDIANKHGHVDIRELDGAVKVTLEDGELNVGNLHGTLVVQASDSRLDFDGIYGTVAVKATDSGVSGISLHGGSRFDVTSGRIVLREFSGDFAMHVVDTTVDARTTLDLDELIVDVIGRIAVFQIGPAGSVKTMGVRASSAQVSMGVPQHLLDHMLTIHSTRGSKVVSEWDLQSVPSDEDTLYRAELGNATYSFDVEALNGARVHLGMAPTSRADDIRIEQRLIVP